MAPATPPLAQSTKMLDMACQTVQDATSQTVADGEAQTTPVAGSPVRGAEIPASLTPSSPSSPTSQTFAESISEGVWLLDRSEGQAPNLRIAPDARQLLGRLESTGNGDELTADLSLTELTQPRSEGEFLRAPEHRTDPRLDPVLAAIVKRRPTTPGNRRGRFPAPLPPGESSAGSSLSEEPRPQDDADYVEDLRTSSPQPPPPPAPKASATTAAPAPYVRRPPPPDTLRSTTEFPTDTPADDAPTERPDVDPDAYLGLTSTATNLLSTNQAIQDAFAATADSASLGATGPRRLTVNLPSGAGLDPVAGSSPDEPDDSVSEISLG